MGAPAGMIPRHNSAGPHFTQPSYSRTHSVTEEAALVGSGLPAGDTAAPLPRAYNSVSNMSDALNLSKQRPGYTDSGSRLEKVTHFVGCEIDFLA